MCFFIYVYISQDLLTLQNFFNPLQHFMTKLNVKTSWEFVKWNFSSFNSLNAVLFVLAKMPLVTVLYPVAGVLQQTAVFCFN